MFTLPISEKTIDLERIIRDKSEKLYRRLPRFVIGWLNRLLHVDELNAYLYKERDAWGIDFATAILDDFGCRITLQGAENLPASGRYILVANHPLGGLDGMAIISRVGAVRPDILFPVNDFLMALPNLRPVFVPIDKTGRNIHNQRLLAEAFASDNLLLYFPAGLCSRKQKDGGIRDEEWKKTFIAKARETQRDIIPVFVDGKNSCFFYNFARWRKRLGLKFNLEQLFLVDEMFKQKGREIRLTVGRPISRSVLEDRSLSDRDWAQAVKAHVYRLADDPQVTFAPRPASTLSI
ncbi:MAG: glycerol acyltransferase [Bacteroidales bacterium]|nr:glycerol acyltransferase [Bacteroidales bacterium]